MNYVGKCRLKYLLQNLGIKFILLHICTSVLHFYKIKEIECLYYSKCEGHYGNYMFEKNKMKRKWIFFLSFFIEYQRFTLQQSYLSFEDTFIRISYIFLIYIIKLIKCCIKSLTFLKKNSNLTDFKLKELFNLVA